ncbi:hypothetical protein NKG94_01955 [Micromonospora sp. M12]
MTLGMLLVVEPVLGLWGVGIVAVTMLTFGAFAVLIVRQQRSALPAEHRAAAMTNQLLGGIVKIKLAAAETRAHARWSEVAAAAERRCNGSGRVRRAWSPSAPCCRSPVNWSCSPC